MGTLRTIRGINLMDRIRTEQIRQNCGIQNVVRCITTRRRCWRDHVKKMGSERLTKWTKTQKHRPCRKGDTNFGHWGHKARRGDAYTNRIWPSVC